MAYSEEKIEKALRDSRFTDARHKKALREKLSRAGQELSEEELGMAAGGVGADNHKAGFRNENSEW